MRTARITQELGGMLLAGGVAEVRGGEALAGSARVWFDESWQVTWTTRRAHPGVWVTMPDGKTALFATSSREAADALLKRVRTWVSERSERAPEGR